MTEEVEAGCHWTLLGFERFFCKGKDFRFFSVSVGGRYSHEKNEQDSLPFPRRLSEKKNPLAVVKGRRRRKTLFLQTKCCLHFYDATSCPLLGWKEFGS